MGLTSIPDQKTPARPVEITFAPELGLPSANQEVLMMGHAQAGAPASALTKVIEIANSGDRVAAANEMLSIGLDSTSEIVKMVLAGIKANEGGSSFPKLKIVAMASTETAFGTSDDALEAAKKVKAEFLVSPYDSQSKTLTDKVKFAAQAMSGATRPDNNQFGTFGVAFSKSSNIQTLEVYDSYMMFLPILRDTQVRSYSIAEDAAAAACVAAANAVPFRPINDVTIIGMPQPALMNDRYTIGGSLESEALLAKGYAPLKVKPTGEVAFVRAITSRLSIDGTGSPVLTSYYDLPDFQKLFFWRKTVWTRESQPDFKRAQASEQTGRLLKGELIRLAKLFETQEMFQRVDQLAKEFKVERSASDRHRFDVKTPVNCIPGLHIVANNIEATVKFDTFSI